MTKASREAAGACTSPRSDQRLIVSGTGRAGTTLLMRIFTAAGLPTGFSPETLHEKIDERAHAGLEWPAKSFGAPDLPMILKSPLLIDLLPVALANGWFTVGHAIVPIRDLKSAAESRRSVASRAVAEKHPRGAHAPGGLWDVADPTRQEEVLAEKFHRLMVLLAEQEIAVTFLSFPRFALDPDYFVRTIHPIVHKRFGLGKRDLRAAHQSETSPRLIGSWA